MWSFHEDTTPCSATSHLTHQVEVREISPGGVGARGCEGARARGREGARARGREGARVRGGDDADGRE